MNANRGKIVSININNNNNRKCDTIAKSERICVLKFNQINMLLGAYTRSCMKLEKRILVEKTILDILIAMRMLLLSGVCVVCYGAFPANKVMCD